MPLAAAVAPLLQGPAGQPYGLYIDSLNVAPFTLMDSVEITEAAPGGVSSMSFVIEDPTGIIPLPAAGAIVRHQDFAFDVPDFLGYVADYTVEVMGIGRVITVDAVGVEIVLDWIVIPSTFLVHYVSPNWSIVSAINIGHVAENIYYLGAEVGQVSDPRLALVAPRSFTTPNGSTAAPIGSLSAPGEPDIGLGGSNLVGPGPLRAAMESAVKVSYYGDFLSPTGTPDAVITVDFYRRLRLFFRSAAPDDYTNLTVSTAGPVRAENIQYEVHPADVIRSVYVVGGNAAGSGFVSDGSGIFGQQGMINAPDSTAAGRRNQVGAQFLASQAALVRGTFELTDWTPTAATIHPASSVTLTDAQVGLAAQTYAIAEITKSFNDSGRQNWTVSFGGIRPSYVETMRQAYSTDPRYLTTKLSRVRSN